MARTRKLHASVLSAVPSPLPTSLPANMFPPANAPIPAPNPVAPVYQLTTPAFPQQVLQSLACISSPPSTLAPSTFPQPIYQSISSLPSTLAPSTFPQHNLESSFASVSNTTSTFASSTFPQPIYQSSFASISNPDSTFASSTFPQPIYQSSWASVTNQTSISAPSTFPQHNLESSWASVTNQTSISAPSTFPQPIYQSSWASISSAPSTISSVSFTQHRQPRPVLEKEVYVDVKMDVDDVNADMEDVVEEYTFSLPPTDEDNLVALFTRLQVIDVPEVNMVDPTEVATLVVPTASIQPILSSGLSFLPFAPQPNVAIPLPMVSWDPQACCWVPAPVSPSAPVATYITIPAEAPFHELPSIPLFPNDYAPVPTYITIPAEGPSHELPSIPLPPNNIAEPDHLGWSANDVTLVEPEPPVVDINEAIFLERQLRQLRRRLGLAEPPTPREVEWVMKGQAAVNRLRSYARPELNVGWEEDESFLAKMLLPPPEPEWVTEGRAAVDRLCSLARPEVKAGSREDKPSLARLLQEEKRKVQREKERRADDIVARDDAYREELKLARCVAAREEWKLARRVADASTVVTSIPNKRKAVAEPEHEERSEKKRKFIYDPSVPMRWPLKKARPVWQSEVVEAQRLKEDERRRVDLRLKRKREESDDGEEDGEGEGEMKGERVARPPMKRRRIEAASMSWLPRSYMTRRK
ncbi:hypothetical protein FPV67DRAFT_1445588 [Lyophyllum atratum]|nr:hypothetical protein FPV67DRAFT_1445588 [Lyophyllum atratum]